MRCGFIGFGSIAHGYMQTGDTVIELPLNHLSSYLSKGLTEVHVYDPEIKRSLKRAISNRNDRVEFIFHNNLESLLLARIDVLSICSPSEMHSYHLHEALSHGCSTIWMEKPFWHDRCLDDFPEVRSSNNLKMQVGYWRPFLVEYLDLKKSIQLGEHQPILVRGLYSRSLLSNGSHMLDLLDFLFGPLAIYGGAPISEDIADLYGFCGDIRWSISGISNTKYNIFEVEIHCVDGVIKLAQNGRKILFSDSKPDPHFSHLNILEDRGSQVDVNWKVAFHRIFDELVNPLNDRIYWKEVFIRQARVGRTLGDGLQYLRK